MDATFNCCEQKRIDGHDFSSDLLFCSLPMRLRCDDKANENGYDDDDDD